MLNRKKTEQLRDSSISFRNDRMIRLQLQTQRRLLNCTVWDPFPPIDWLTELLLNEFLFFVLTTLFEFTLLMLLL